MNQPQVIPKYILKFVTIKADKPLELDWTITIPSIQQLPLPGDEIQLPKEIVSQAGFDKNVFKVKSRRFIFDSIPPGIAGIIYLKLS